MGEGGQILKKKNARPSGGLRVWPLTVTKSGWCVRCLAFNCATRQGDVLAVWPLTVPQVRVMCWLSGL